MVLEESITPRGDLGRLHGGSVSRLFCVYHGQGSCRERHPALLTQAVPATEGHGSSPQRGGPRGP